MRKPGRGKASSKKKMVEESSSTAAKDLPPKGSTRRGKRVKAPPTKEEPEFFPEKRNLEDLWKAAFPVGTEWDQLDSVYQINWDFSNLENAFDEGGELYGKKVYLFGCTEPQLVFFNNGEGKVICIPVVVAVVSPFPPSDKIGVKSVQRENEEIIPMKQMKMAWVPYIPLEDRDSRVDRLKTQIFTLSCTQRRAALRHLKIERIKKYEYCLPHFYNPLVEDEQEQDTVVQIIYPSEPPIVAEFDWELDELEEFVDERIKEEVLPEDQKDAFTNFIKEKVRESKRAQREAREARQAAVEQMDEEKKEAYRNMRFYKFYPVQTPDTPDISKLKNLPIRGLVLGLSYSNGSIPIGHPMMIVAGTFTFSNPCEMIHFSALAWRNNSRKGAYCSYCRTVLLQRGKQTPASSTYGCLDFQLIITFMPKKDKISSSPTEF